MADIDYEFAHIENELRDFERDIDNFREEIKESIRKTDFEDLQRDTDKFREDMKKGIGKIRRFLEDIFKEVKKK